MLTACRGVRGATTVAENTPTALAEATAELLRALVLANGIALEDVASVFFTTTPDLTADFPARAAREMGWTEVALLCATEIAVPSATPRCMRVLIHWNTALRQGEISHIYLHGAAALRPDLVRAEEISP